MNELPIAFLLFLICRDLILGWIWSKDDIINLLIKLSFVGTICTAGYYVMKMLGIVVKV